MGANSLSLSSSFSSSSSNFQFFEDEDEHEDEKDGLPLASSQSNLAIYRPLMTPCTASRMVFITPAGSLDLPKIVKDLAIDGERASERLVY